MKINSTTKTAVLIMILILIGQAGLFSESLIEIDLMPIRNLKKINSMAIFQFDGKLINSGRLQLVDYLNISYDYYRYLLKKFSSVKGIQISHTDKLVSVYEGDEIKVYRGKDIPQYDEKVLSTGTVISKKSLSAIDVYLYGRINKYYEGKSFEMSYIDITVYLVDSKSKIIYWTTDMRGCLQYVSDALISIIMTGDYIRPAKKDIRDLGWINPYTARVRNWALQYRLGYMIMTGEIGDRIENGRVHNFALNFKLPVWGNLSIYNQIELSILSSFQTIDENDPLKDYTYNTYLPFIFNFIYRDEKLLNLPTGFVPYAKVGLGASLNRVYFSGYGQHDEQFDPVLSLKTVLDIGLGIEYNPKEEWNILGLRFRIDKLGFITEFDYYTWFNTELSSSAVNISLGVKYYL